MLKSVLKSMGYMIGIYLVMFGIVFLDYKGIITDVSFLILVLAAIPSYIGYFRIKKTTNRSRSFFISSVLTSAFMSVGAYFFTAYISDERSMPWGYYPIYYIITAFVFSVLLVDLINNTRRSRIRKIERS